MNKVKTINFYFLFWHCAVFAFGAIAETVFACSIVNGSLTMHVIIYVTMPLFALVALIGAIGIVVLLRKYIILKRVLEYGAETIGKYDAVGNSATFDRKLFFQVKFTYTAGGESRRYTSCAVYSDEQITRLRKLGTFTIKHKGRHAIICDPIALSDCDIVNVAIKEPAVVLNENTPKIASDFGGKHFQKFRLTINSIKNTVIFKAPLSVDLVRAVSTLKTGIEAFLILESNIPIDKFVLIQATGFENETCYTEAQIADGDTLRNYGTDNMTEQGLLEILHEFLSGKAPDITGWKHVGDF